MSSSFEAWLPRLRVLAERLRLGVAAARRERNANDLRQQVGEGVGDVTFALDEVAEQVVATWLDEQPAPFSLLTEDRGWTHVTRTAAQTVTQTEQDGFAHEGPRIVVDPIDGTRPLLAGLRSAWVVIGFADAGCEPPRFGDLSGGLLMELTTTGEPGLVFWASAGGPCWVEEPHAGSPRLRHLRVDEDDRCDQGHFSFFRYHPSQRLALAQVEATFFERLKAHEGADLRSVYEDAYCSSAGQLVLLALGSYRFLADLRPELGGAPESPTAKPYDLAGALVVARAAGVVVCSPAGGGLDAPLDATTPVGFVGYVNAATAAKLAPHLAAARAVLGASEAAQDEASRAGSIEVDPA